MAAEKLLITLLLVTMFVTFLGVAEKIKGTEGLHTISALTHR